MTITMARPEKDRHRTPDKETARAEPSQSFQEGIIAAIPNLRAFATSLCGRASMADDLVQETLMRAWAKHDSFQEGTKLLAWLFTILRNEFYTVLRKRKREVEDIDGEHAAKLVTKPSQLPSLDLEDFQVALTQIPDEQREALVLIGIAGFSYIEAAEIMGCAVGTVKSRLSRARTRIEQILEGEEVEALAS